MFVRCLYIVLHSAAPPLAVTAVDTHILTRTANARVSCCVSVSRATSGGTAVQGATRPPRSTTCMHQ